MEAQFLVSALQLAAYLGGCVVLGIAAGGLVGAIIRVATQLDDPSIALVSRLAAFLIFATVASSHVVNQVLKFSLRVWGGQDTYGL